MPKQAKPPNFTGFNLIQRPFVKDPILSTGPPKDYEDWKIKNARAKALIMSTLTPGSEPWKIAEPLELASEIWKALEERYGPKAKQEAALQAEKEASELATESGQIGSDADVALKRRKAKAKAAQDFKASIPDRDQRFLWALLHGGKEETTAWINGANPNMKLVP